MDYIAQINSAENNFVYVIILVLPVFFILVAGINPPSSQCEAQGFLELMIMRAGLHVKLHAAQLAAWPCFLATTSGQRRRHVDMTRGTTGLVDGAEKDVYNSPGGHLCNFIARFAENWSPQEPDM